MKSRNTIDTKPEVRRGQAESVLGKFDLQSYLARFPEVCQRKFGRSFEFSKLEKEFEQLRTGGRRLTARDAAKLFEPDRTPFARYWQPPELEALGRNLDRQPYVLMAPVVENGRHLVERLLHVFHSLGVASLLLRMVHPDQFGIFSTPIVNLLQIHRANAVELYLAFCAELRIWQERFGLPSVAQTEMALWTYHELTASPLQGADVERVKREFEDDVWIQRRRVDQTVTPFLANHGPVELAEILAERQPRLAAMLAGVEFERLMRLKWRALYGKGEHKPNISVDAMIEDLAERSVIERNERSELRGIWGTRNKAVHPDRRLSSEEVEAMIASIKAICFDWEDSAFRKRAR